MHAALVVVMLHGAIMIVICRQCVMMITRVALGLRGNGRTATRCGEDAQIQPGDDAENQEPCENQIFQLRESASSCEGFKQKSGSVSGCLKKERQCMIALPMWGQ